MSGSKNAFLYHGTSESAAQRIIRSGIKPRGSSGQNGHWHKIGADSHPAAVYLTDCWALFFANVAAKAGQRWAIIEVDVQQLSRDRLQFDEDILAQRNQGRFSAGVGVLEAVAYCRKVPWKFPEFKDWRLSLELGGSCAYYGAITPRAITRAILIDAAQLPNEFKKGIAERHFTLPTFASIAEPHFRALQWILDAANEAASFCEVIKPTITKVRAAKAGG